MKNLIVLIIFLLSTSLYANDLKLGSLTLTPIVGVERIQKFEPTATMKTRLMYGARTLIALPISSIEIEATMAKDSSSDSSTNTTYEDKEVKLRLGLRGSSSQNGLYSYYIRGGAQLRANTQTKKVGNAAATETTTRKGQPYLGVGLTGYFTKIFTVSLELLATYAPTTNSKLDSIELQPTFGFTVLF